jgi:hypothetical protein
VLADEAAFFSPLELLDLLDEPEPESADLDPLPESLADFSELDEELSDDELSPPEEPPDPFAAPAGTVLPLPLRLSVR